MIEEKPKIVAIIPCYNTAVHIVEIIYLIKK